MKASAISTLSSPGQTLQKHSKTHVIIHNSLLFIVCRQRLGLGAKLISSENHESSFGIQRCSPAKQFSQLASWCSHDASSMHLAPRDTKKIRATCLCICPVIAIITLVITTELGCWDSYCVELCKQVTEGRLDCLLWIHGVMMINCIRIGAQILIHGVW